MHAVINRSKIENFNLTRKSQLFLHENYGGLYIQPEKYFQEISQAKLNSFTDNNEFNSENLYAEFNSEDFFVEKSFNELNDAKRFVRQTFSKYQFNEEHCKVDILNKLTFFYSFFKLKKVNCRFEILSGNSCKKFHYDNVQARMISTYAGPGTQIKGPQSKEIFNLPSGSTLIVKGTKFPDFKPVTLHRSPQIDNANLKRFLFIADF